MLAPCLRAFQEALRAWPKTILSGQAGFIITLCGGIEERNASRQRLAIVPWHPFRRAGGQFLCMALQLDQVVEGVDAT